MSFVQIGDRLVNSDEISSATLDHRHYMNGSATYLVVTLKNGEVLSREHGYGFDAYATIEKIKTS